MDRIRVKFRVRCTARIGLWSELLFRFNVRVSVKLRFIVMVRYG